MRWAVTRTRARSRRLTWAVLGVVALTASLPPARAVAWNHKAHMAIAYIAYAHLTPEDRARLLRILQAHPDVATLSRLAGSPGRGDHPMRQFIHASRWPDLIRDDPRFWDETDPHAHPTPPLPHFPDMKKHKAWHFRDEAFTTDGTGIGPPDQTNAATAIRAARRSISNPHLDRPHRAYALAWLAHLVGDVHQPLHCATRVTREHPRGDRGGNLFEIVPFRIHEVAPDPDNLHSFWDGVLGGDTRLAAVRALARDAERADPTERPDDLDEAVWLRESFEYARSVAYAPLDGQAAPPRITQSYFDAARALALGRVKLAGHRLAAVLQRDLN